jgi:hypothetical protein
MLLNQMVENRFVFGKYFHHVSELSHICELSIQWKPFLRLPGLVTTVAVRNVKRLRFVLNFVVMTKSRNVQAGMMLHFVKMNDMINGGPHVGGGSHGTLTMPAFFQSFQRSIQGRLQLRISGYFLFSLLVFRL